MRALTVEELGFVSGGFGAPNVDGGGGVPAVGGVPAGTGTWRDVINQSGLTETERAYALKVMGEFIAAAGVVTALADRRALVRVAGAALSLVGLSLSVAADAIVFTLVPSPAY
jgi:hypothetical protein